MTTPPVTPLGDRLIVRQLESKSTTAGGIIIPDNAKEKPQFGVIEAVASQIKQTQELRVGSIILFGKYAGMNIDIDSGTRLLLREEEVIGVVTDRAFAERCTTSGA